MHIYLKSDLPLIIRSENDRWNHRKTVEKLNQQHMGGLNEVKLIKILSSTGSAQHEYSNLCNRREKTLFMKFSYNCKANVMKHC
jgi:hypothetical protein